MPWNPAKQGLYNNPKTDQQEQQNWSRVQRTLQMVGDPQRFFTDGGVSIVDTIREIFVLIVDLQSGVIPGADIYVKVNSADPTSNYLENQMRDGHVEASAEYNSSQDLLVEVDTVDNAGDKQLRFFVDRSDIAGASTAVQQTLTFTITTGAATLVEYGLVKTDSGDSAGYLDTKFNDTGTFAAATDALVIEQTTSHKAKLGARFSGVSGYDATKYQMFVNDNGTIKWVTLTSTGVVNDVSWDTGTCVMTKSGPTNYYLKAV